mmetsp:Transcript_19176/g.37922  ORF Transcript_19176/g.37922 Transcript_19176/m.37922 type:complete len:215 (-) Transcript_19176:121-765(-)
MVHILLGRRVQKGGELHHMLLGVEVDARHQDRQIVNNAFVGVALVLHFLSCFYLQVVRCHFVCGDVFQFWHTLRARDRVEMELSSVGLSVIIEIMGSSHCPQHVAVNIKDWVVLLVTRVHWQQHTPSRFFTVLVSPDQLGVLLPIQLRSNIVVGVPIFHNENRVDLPHHDFMGPFHAPVATKCERSPTFGTTDMHAQFQKVSCRTTVNIHFARN